MKWSALILASAATLLVTGAPWAVTITVAPDGSGDFPTIRHAVQAAVDGDVIELLPGTFRGPGNRDIRLLGKAITIESSSGDPEACIIDCEGEATGFFIRDGEGRDTVVRNLTVTRGQSATVGGILILYSAPTIEGVRLVDNVAIYGLGAGGVYSFQSDAVIRDCYFEGNVSGAGAGAIWSREDSGIRITGCEFIGNRNTSSIVSSGAVSVEQGDGLVVDCLFRGNEAANGPAAVGVLFNATCHLVGCTIVENGGGWTTAVFAWSALSIDRSIVAFNDGSFVECFDSEVEISCADAFGNMGGDWEGCAGDLLGVDGNIDKDPLFCEFEDEWSIRSDSPCAPDNSGGCGLIGSEGVGCGVVPVLETSWGGLKLWFR